MSTDGYDASRQAVEIAKADVPAIGSATFVGLGVYISTLPIKEIGSIDQATASGRMLARYGRPIKGAAAAPFLLLGLYRLMN